MLGRILLCSTLLTACNGWQRPPDENVADLPNHDLIHRDHDGGSYLRIARHFESLGHDLDGHPENLALDWPMIGDERVLLTRFGTPIRLNDWGYYHTAVDVLPTDEAKEVFAPVGGIALLFDWSGNVGYHGSDLQQGSFYPRGDYSTVVAIYDPISKTVVQLMHVRPTEALRDADDEPVMVVRGEKVGDCAPLPSLGFEPEAAESFRHVHLSIADAKAERALDPNAYSDYRDLTPPTIIGHYLLDQNAERTVVPSEADDLVVELFDRDEDSNRNFSVAEVSLRAFDADGAVVHEVPNCRLSDLFSDISDPEPFNTIDLVDLGSAENQIGAGGWPQADTGDPLRRFRFALNRLSMDRTGRCTIDIPNAVIWNAATTIEVVATDASGNRATYEAEMTDTLTTPP